MRKRILACVLSITIVLSSNSICYAAQGNDAIEELTEEQVEYMAEPASDEQTSEEYVAEDMPDEELASELTTGEEEGASTEQEVSSEEQTEEGSSPAGELPAEEQTEEGSSPAEELSTEEQTEAITTEAVTEEQTEELTTEEELLDMTALATNRSTFVMADLKVDEEGRLYNDNANGDKPYGDIVIPAKAKIIATPQSSSSEYNLFKDNKQITSITFPDNSELTKIEYDAFRGCTITNALELPKSLTTIGDSAFHGANIGRITLKSGGEPVTIAENAFNGCIGLTTFIANERIVSIGEDAFANCMNLKSNSTMLTQTAAIGESAFEGCKSLTYVVLSSKLKDIPAAAFKDCTSLGTAGTSYAGIEAVQIKDGTERIAEDAFSGCTGLTAIQLPGTVLQVSKNAFYGCRSLKEVRILNAAGENGVCDIALSYASFPSVSGLKLYAYDGTAEQWYADHASSGVAFESLYEKHSISLRTIGGGSVKVTSGSMSVKKGDKVTLQVKAASGYQLKNQSLKYEYTMQGGSTGTVLIDDTCSFKMPDANIWVLAEFEKISETDYGTQLTAEEDSWEFSSSQIRYEKLQNGQYCLKIPKTGETAKLVVVGDDGLDNYPAPTELQFKSSNNKVATISSTGLIKAVGEGSTTITASLKVNNHNTAALSFSCTVADKGEIAYIKTADWEATKGTYTESGEEALELGMGIFTYSKNMAAVMARTITLTVQGYDEADDKMEVGYKWITTDATIASPGQAATNDGKNTIIVKKGAVGEAVITCKAKDNEEVMRQYVVRVADTTPRLSETSYTINPNSTLGTEVDVIAVYGTTVDMDSLEVCKRVQKNKEVTYEAADDLFPLQLTDGRLYMQANDNIETNGAVTIKAGTKYTYKNQYYIRGEMDDATRQEFFIPIPTLIIQKTELKPRFTTSGKINLFYNSAASATEVGAVTIKQSLTDLTVARYAIDGIVKTNGKNKDDDSAFENNFQVAYQNNTFTITRSGAELANYSAGGSKGKPVVKGILRVWYEGYQNPVETTITIPTYNTAPQLQLSTTAITLQEATFNTAGATISYSDIQVLDKKTREPLDLVAGTTLYYDESNSGTTMGLVDTTVVNSFDADRDTIGLTLQDAKKGKIVYVLRQPSWSSGIKLTLNVKTTSAQPKVKLSRNQLSLNNVCLGMTDAVELTLDQRDVALAASQEFYPTGRTQNENLKLKYTYDATAKTGKVTASVEGEVKTGTYSFSCVPAVQYTNASDTTALRAINIKVKVISAQPQITLKSNVFTLNSIYSQQGAASRDVAVRQYSWKNLTSEYNGYTLDTSAMTLTCTDKAGDGGLKDDLQCRIDPASMEISVSMLKRYTNVNATYQISGLKLVKDGYADVAVAPLTMKVKSINKEYTVTVSGKGSINPLDISTSMVYTPKLNNINGTVEDVSLLELDENGVLIRNEAEQHFAVRHDKAANKTYVTLKDNVTLKNRTYKIKLVYSISSTDRTYTTGDLSIKPVQKLPTIQQSTKTASFYAGNKAYTQQVAITQKAGISADIQNVVIHTGKTAQDVRDAFAVSYDAATGVATIRLKNSACIRQNKAYNIVFEIVCDGQLENTTGTTFTVKATVKK